MSAKNATRRRRRKKGGDDAKTRKPALPKPRVGSKIRKTAKTQPGKSCHPDALRNPTITSDSCLTSKKIEYLKQTYNSKHPSRKILATNPAVIHQELTKRFPECKKDEKCWIGKIIGEKALDKIYRPISPADWKQNPVEWLSNLDIGAVMKQYEETYPEFDFLGPVPIDFDKDVSDVEKGVEQKNEISDSGGKKKKKDESKCVSVEVCGFHLADKIKLGKTKIGIVFNLSPSTSSGSHWVSLYVHLPDSVGGRKPAAEDMVVASGGGKLAEDTGDGDWNNETPYCFFFDSAGGKVPKEIEDLIVRFQTEWAEYVAAASGGAGMRGLAPKMFYDSNVRTKTEHQRGNTECGVYSIFFVTTMLTGKCAGGGVESDSCALSLDTEQKKVDYFQGEKDGGEKIRIPDSFMEELRAVFFTPHA
jgi:hypothetical protein